MLKINPAEGSAEYLTVSEAADFLGVSPWTLRNWDKSGRLKPSRHPKNGYRIYRRQDLAAVMEPVESLSGLRAKFTPRIDWRDMGDSEHFVQFYETDSFLVDSVSGFVGTALVTGQAEV